MKRLKVGLNGFGRIGRAFTRIAALRNSFDLVAINTRKTPTPIMAYTLQYDSIYRKFSLPVSNTESSLTAGPQTIAALQFASPEEIPWDQYGVDVVVDATGAFTKKEDLSKHIKGTVQKVILTAPAKDDITPHVVLGVNDNQIDWAKETVISNASCTTNCASPMFKILHDNLNIITGFITTTHAYTQTQSLQDDANKEIERSRAAPLNIVPSTTGAAKAIVKTIPDLKGRIDGMATRVPVPTGSFSDVSVVVEKQTSVAEVNEMFRAAAEGAYKGIVGYETQILVSSDYIGNPHSCTFDANYTKVLNGHFVKAFGWYDNEWGYSTRLVDLVDKLGSMM